MDIWSETDGADGMGTSVMSREAAAALMCKLGCLTELLQSNARAKVPTALHTDHQIHHANLIMPSVSSVTVFCVFYSSGSQLAGNNPKTDHRSVLMGVMERRGKKYAIVWCKFICNSSVSIQISWFELIPIHKLPSHLNWVHLKYNAPFAIKNQYLVHNVFCADTSLFIHFLTPCQHQGYFHGDYWLEKA